MIRTPTRTAVSADEALSLILAGEAPDDLRVEGALEIVGAKGLTRLPAGLTARRLTLKDCPRLEELPEGLNVRHLEISGCPRLTTLPAGLRCYEIRARASALEELPDGLRVEFRLDLADSPRLRRLPRGLTVGALVLRNCAALEALPEGLDVSFLDLEGCARLRVWPREMRFDCGHLNLAGCAALAGLPSGLGRVAQLDLRGCAGVRDLPPALDVGSWIDVAGSGVAALPPSLRDVRLRWRGVPVDERTAFRPETLTADDVLREPNAELRRVMLERVGFERFVQEAHAEVLDADRDAGGERRLLRVPLPDDEPLVCVTVVCPSTGRRYVLRVPPATRTCRQAAAWMAGFDDPDEYRPVVET
jgi:hypothetical protein